jgi:pimeloyl-ACP methyl ester carboxylesterase
MSELRCPTLLLSGALDAKYDALAKRMSGAIPNSMHVTIPGAGHNIHLEQPEAFARTLLDRWSRVEGAPRREAPLPA